MDDLHYLLLLSLGLIWARKRFWKSETKRLQIENAHIKLNHQNNLRAIDLQIRALSEGRNRLSVGTVDLFPEHATATDQEFFWPEELELHEK